MNKTSEPESHTIIMLYKATRDAYYNILGTGLVRLTERDKERLRASYETLKTIIQTLDVPPTSLPKD